MPIVKLRAGALALAVALMLSDAPVRAQGTFLVGPVFDYQTRHAYTTYDDQVLEGREELRTGWIVPVLLPRDARRPSRGGGRTVVELVDTTMIWEALGPVPDSPPDVIVDGVNHGAAERLPSPLSHLYIATFPLVRARMVDTHHEVEAVLRTRGRTYRSRLETITLRPTTPFILLLPTFRHDRCENCHSLRTDERKRAFHASFGVTLPAEPRCFICHTESLTGASWVAPTPLQAPDFRAIEGNGDLCRAVTDELLEEQHAIRKFRKHFHKDERLAWAIVNGHVPFREEPLPTAPPHDLVKLRDYADWWLAWTIFGEACTGLP